MASPNDSVDSLKDAAVHVERVLSDDEKNNNTVCGDAAHAEAVESSMGLLEGIKTYPHAIFWSFAISLLISTSLCFFSTSRTLSNSSYGRL